MESRDAYLEQLEENIAGFRDRVAQAEKKLKDVGVSEGDRREELIATVVKARNKLSEVETQRDILRAAEGDRWQEVKSGIESAAEDLDSTLPSE